MAITFDGKEIELTANGYLVDITDWSEGLAKQMAADEDIELTDKHWDLINFLRDQFINNGGKNPNTRALIKEMGTTWGEKIGSKDLYNLFPQDPSKQGGRISGLPESKRKGGY
ncbi:MAG: TusE/DsrC/DsvC family sulfur relay protein [gamma proteobacterium symbiont of Lucinoma myriamae]|nr:TusE/DsrC/DsvC family sulfur relay protein [gamma proteobacterium symbiont of Lucinoma myriamae]MCU7820000.1 TusE/DsrC/DsvC family sulfur relay protein [gamma proteobacterium symbiont of Lucinoma myriamae]MCU7832436.1 TusE/DsrC/DsvC family sulfur relay protein [gamma proteobacterium symbiont of Lucinoma myriamae]